MKTLSNLPENFSFILPRGHSYILIDDEDNVYEVGRTTEGSLFSNKDIRFVKTGDYVRCIEFDDLPEKEEVMDDVSKNDEDK